MMILIYVKVEVKGPFEKLAYTPNMKKTLCMIAGGSGTCLIAYVCFAEYVVVVVAGLC